MVLFVFQRSEFVPVLLICARLVFRPILKVLYVQGLIRNAMPLDRPRLTAQALLFTDNSLLHRASNGYFVFCPGFPDCMRPGVEVGLDLRPKTSFVWFVPATTFFAYAEVSLTR